MTSSQKRALRAGYTPPPVLCACGHTREAHRYQPQIGACPAEGCDCTGYHMEGAAMPTPAPEPPKPTPPPPPTKLRQRYGGLAAMLAIATLSAGSAGPPEPLPTKRLS